MSALAAVGLKKIVQSRVVKKFKNLVHHTLMLIGTRFTLIFVSSGRF